MRHNHGWMVFTAYGVAVADQLGARLAWANSGDYSMAFLYTKLGMALLVSFYNYSIFLNQGKLKLLLTLGNPRVFFDKETVSQ